MIEPLAALLRALSFLSRLPVQPGAFRKGHALGADAPLFPVAGALLALAAALPALLFTAAGLSPLAAAALAVALLVALTGALHEDGLADTADGLFGHHGRERALEIMRDSRIGAYGALALLLSVLLRVTILADLLAHGASAFLVAFVLAGAASRGAMAHLWSSLPAAGSNGLAAHLGAPTAARGRLALGLGLASLVVGGAIAAGWAGALLPALFVLTAHALFRRVVRRRLGGATGDTLGADQQITEIAVLLGFALAL